MQRIKELFTAWHGKNQDVSACVRRRAHRTLARKLKRSARRRQHDLGYTIHLNRAADGS